ncbi:SDR family oxidoreductase [Gammaproteobacteria bacterium]|nr:SDR family oxidoreductase [Gammaproteobacteria bacterium]
MYTTKEDDLFDLEGRTILVTGACGTLGRRYCEEYLKRKANVLMVDVEETGVEEKAQSLSNIFGIEAYGYTVDVGDEKQVHGLFEKIKNEHGEVDVVLNNAAATGEFLMKTGEAFADFEDYSLELWNKVLKINLTGPFLIAKHASSIFSSLKGGSLINVSSIYGFVAPDHRIYEGVSFSSFPSYSASKAGIHGLTLWLSSYWAKRGIRVNTLVPGGVFNGQEKAFVESYSNRTPMDRMAVPEDMVGAVIYLSSQASCYVTGQKFVVDGGLSSW